MCKHSNSMVSTLNHIRRNWGRTDGTPEVNLADHERGMEADERRNILEKRILKRTLKALVEKGHIEGHEPYRGKLGFLWLKKEKV